MNDGPLPVQRFPKELRRVSPALPELQQERWVGVLDRGLRHGPHDILVLRSEALEVLARFAGRLDTGKQFQTPLLHRGAFLGPLFCVDSSATAIHFFSYLAPTFCGEGHSDSPANRGSRCLPTLCGAGSQRGILVLMSVSDSIPPTHRAAGRNHYPPDSRQRTGLLPSRRLLREERVAAGCPRFRSVSEPVGGGPLFTPFGNWA